MAIPNHYYNNDFGSDIYPLIESTMKKNQLLLLLIMAIILSSCHSGSILKRRYQKGYYVYNKKQDNDLIANANTKQLFCKPRTPIEIIRNKSNDDIFIDHKSSRETIVPGDCIIVIKKKKTKTLVQRFKTDNDYDITISIDDLTELELQTKENEPRNKDIKGYQIKSFVSIFVWIIPIIGLVFTLNAWHTRKKLKQYNENEIIKKNRVRLIIATVLAFIFNLLTLSLLAFNEFLA